VEKKRNKGVALIAVIVMIVLFSSLIMVVVLSSTMSIKRAYFYHDRTKALEIAENAIQDVFNWMNYRAYDTEYYPSWYANNQPPDSPTKVYFTGTTFSPSPVKVNAPYIPEKGECIVEFFDDNGENKDTITAIGKYRGRTAKLSVKVRGENGYDNNTHKNFALRLGNIETFQVDINFEPIGANPSIQYPDKGEVFGDRGNGYKYGWSEDRTGYVYDRDILPNSYQYLDNQYLDTLAIMNGAKWEIEVPNWYYSVTVDCGDPMDPECDDYNHDLIIEGQLSHISSPNFSVSVLRNPGPPPVYDVYWYKRHIVDVTVNDGRLTIEPVDTSNNGPRICHIQIRPNSGVNWATPEAFNKHLVYSNTVSGNTGSNQILVNGNITYNNWQANLNYKDESKKTFTHTSSFSIPRNSASISIPVATTLQQPNFTPTPTMRFKDSNGSTPYDPATGYNSYTDLTNINGGNDPYNVSGTSEYYTFSNLSNLSSGTYFFEKTDSKTQLQIKFTPNSNPNIPSGIILKAGAIDSGEAADIIIDVNLDSSTSILGQLMAERNIEITGSIPVSIGSSNQYTIAARDTVKISPSGNLTINGNIYGGKKVYIQANNNTITINGNICADNQSENSEIEIRGTGTININGKIYAKTKITIDGTGLNLTISDEVNCPGEVIIQGSGNVTINKDLKGGLQTGGSVNLTVNGSVFSNTANIPINIGGTGNININGVIAGVGVITISNSKLTVDARNTNYAGAICWDGNGTITISSSPAIYLGEHQYSAIFVDSGTGDVNINARINPNYYLPTSQSVSNQMAIINKSSSNNININAEVVGPVYSRTNITVGTNGKVKGAIITDGTLTLNGGEIIYDSAPFKNNTEVYKGFTGGRRKYLPVIGSWRIEW